MKRANARFDKENKSHDILSFIIRLIVSLVFSVIASFFLIGYVADWIYIKFAGPPCPFNIDSPYNPADYKHCAVGEWSFLLQAFFVTTIILFIASLFFFDRVKKLAN